MTDGLNLFEISDDTWQQRLDFIVETMRLFSADTDPDHMVDEYGRRMRSVMPSHRMLSLSRRGVPHPQYVIARNSDWERQPNVRSQRHELPILQGGLLGELIYSDAPHHMPQLDIASDDPARKYLEGFKSLIALPVFDEGESRNMVVFLHREADGLHRELIPPLVWTTNLVGRATHTAALSQELRRANAIIEREMQNIADIQQSLLPRDLPQVDGLDVAAFYQPATHAGGDYYDFFPLGERRLGILLGDVSGHGSPAAVLMAITHTLAHTHDGPPVKPAAMFRHVNHHLAARYTNGNGRFVTAFYGIYDANTRTLTYACAGHDPPRIKRCSDGSLFNLDQAQGLPLGIADDTVYTSAEVQLEVGDQVIFYTDGITEARNPKSDMFTTARLDEALANCSLTAQGLIDDVIARLESFVGLHDYDDDRTVLVARVTR